MKKVIAYGMKMVELEDGTKMYSETCGRENYVIQLYEGKVTFSGTKKQWLDGCKHIMTLAEGFRTTNLFYTYKKDWQAALKNFN